MTMKHIDDQITSLTRYLGTLVVIRNNYDMYDEGSRKKLERHMEDAFKVESADNVCSLLKEVSPHLSVSKAKEDDDTSDSDFSSSDTSISETTSSSSSSSESSSSSSSDEEEIACVEKPKDEDTNKKVNKRNKKKIDEEKKGKAEPSEVPTEKKTRKDPGVDSSKKDLHKAIPSPKPSTSPSKVNQTLSNNFLDRPGATKSSHGYKAYEDFSKSRGKEFRQEKNKKKRGSYHGGPIDTHGVNSTKLD